MLASDSCSFLMRVQCLISAGNAHFPSLDAALLSISGLEHVHAAELECLISLAFLIRVGSWHHGLRNSTAFAAAFFAPLCFGNLEKTLEIREKMQSGNPWEFLRKPSGIHEIPTAKHRKQHPLFLLQLSLHAGLQASNADTAGLQTRSAGTPIRVVVDPRGAVVVSQHEGLHVPEAPAGG